MDCYQKLGAAMMLAQLELGNVLIERHEHGSRAENEALREAALLSELVLKLLILARDLAKAEPGN